MAQGTEGTTMPFLARPHNSAFPEALPVLPQSPSSRRCSEPKPTDTWDYGFKRLVPHLQSPPFGAGFLAITLFFFIAFFSNILLSQVNSSTLGISVTIGTFGILVLVILILFLI